LIEAGETLTGKDGESVSVTPVADPEPTEAIAPVETTAVPAVEASPEA